MNQLHFCKINYASLDTSESIFTFLLACIILTAYFQTPLITEGTAFCRCLRLSSNLLGNQNFLMMSFFFPFVKFIYKTSSHILFYILSDKTNVLHVASSHISKEHQSISVQQTEHSKYKTQESCCYGYALTAKIKISKILGFGCLYFGCYCLSFNMPLAKSQFDFELLHGYQIQHSDVVKYKPCICYCSSFISF